ncbi:MAG: phosphatidate cytidylyltransferase [Frankiaceae bacterium]|nr:phosphatidate cytidylyltransferase [Frankiaceae bacterium]
MANRARPNSPAPTAGPAVQVPAPKGSGRAGRDLRAAIGVGMALAGLILVSVYTVRVIWIGVLCLAVAMGTYELARAVKTADLQVPVIPLVVAGAALPAIAYARGVAALVAAALIAVFAAMCWQVLEPVQPTLRDLSASALCIVYVGFLAGFAALLSTPGDGPRRITIFVSVTVASDIGGYAAGVLSGGRHKMAPTISPGKSWEGFAGSALTCMVTGGIMVPLMLTGGTVLEGVALGAALVGSATLGDLGESMLKRDIGIKDMSDLLPGHGGIMDRLDSLLPSAPVAWLLLTAFT